MLARIICPDGPSWGMRPRSAIVSEASRCCLKGRAGLRAAKQLSLNRLGLFIGRCKRFMIPKVDNRFRPHRK